MSEAVEVTRYRRVPHVERRLSGGRRLVQTVDALRAIQLAGSAPMIWDLLDENPEPEQVAAQLQQHFSDPPTVIAAGVEVGLASLVDSKLVVVE